MLQRDHQAFKNVHPVLGLSQFVAHPAGDDLDAVLEEELQDLRKCQDLGLFVHDGEHDDAEARLHRRVLVEIT